MNKTQKQAVQTWVNILTPMLNTLGSIALEAAIACDGAEKRTRKADAVLTPGNDVYDLDEGFSEVETARDAVRSAINAFSAIVQR